MEEFKEVNGQLALSSGGSAPQFLPGDIEYLSYYARNVAAIFSRAGGFTAAGFREDSSQLSFRADHPAGIRGVRSEKPVPWSRTLQAIGL
jgi:hypothetical protein